MRLPSNRDSHSMTLLSSLALVRRVLIGGRALRHSVHKIVERKTHCKRSVHAFSLKLWIFTPKCSKEL